MTGRAIRSIIVVTVCWAVAAHLEDLARWLRMRDMSNPKRYPQPTDGAAPDR